MDIALTARHCAIPASVRARAERRLRRLTRYDGRLARAEVTFDADHGVQCIEVRLFVAGGPTIIVEGRDRACRAALDRVLDRAGRRLQRQSEMRRDRALRAPVPVPYIPAGDD